MASTSTNLILSSEEIKSEEHGEIDIRIDNILCAFNLPFHIDLRRIAMTNTNVDFDRSQPFLTKQLRIPRCTAKIWSSGKVTIALCRKENECRIASRKIGRMIQRSMDKLDQRVFIRNYKICNIFAICRMPFGIKVEDIPKKYKQARYEPELFCGVSWSLENPKATLRIHTTGTIQMTGVQSESDLKRCVEFIYPIVKELECQKRYGETVSVQEKNLIRKRTIAKAESSQEIGNNEFFIAKRSRLNKQNIALFENKLYFSDEDEDEFEEYTDEIEDF